MKKLNNMNPLLTVQNPSEDKKWVKIISCTNAKFTKKSNMLEVSSSLSLGISWGKTQAIA